MKTSDFRFSVLVYSCYVLFVGTSILRRKRQIQGRWKWKPVSLNTHALSYTIATSLQNVNTWRLVALQLQRYPLPLTLTEPASCYTIQHGIQHAAIPHSTHTVTSCYSARTSEQTAIISQYKVKVFFYTMLPDFATAVLFGEFSSFVRLFFWYATCRWRWSIGGMILTSENRSTRRKTHPTATLSTINHTWTDLGSNPASVMTGRRQTALHNTAVTNWLL